MCTQLPIECAQGFFCKSPGGDGGTGTCQAARALGQTCGDFTADPTLADEACSWRSSGDTKRYCAFVADFDAGTTKDAGDWKCANALPNGQGCYLSTWCAAGICDPNDTSCKAQLPYFEGACKQVVTP